MKADAYTKTVLTVIAICLIWICARDFVVPVTAQRQNLGEQRVIISDVDIRNERYGSTRYIPIRIEASNIQLPVSLEKIDVEDPTKPKEKKFGLSGERMEAQRTNSLPITLAKVALEPTPVPLAPGLFSLDGSGNRIYELPVSVKSVDVEDPYTQNQSFGVPPKRTKSLPVHSPTPPTATNRR